MTSLLPPDQRLRSASVVRPFHVILVNPEIPPNTGNVARLCAATGCLLHLVKPLGFRIDDHAVRRAGLDYWPLVELRVHDTLLDAETAARACSISDHGRQPRAWLFSGRATSNLFDVEVRLGDALVFGRESVGLDEALLASRADCTVAIPTTGPVRSLNLANSVAIAVYESMRQNCLMTGAVAGGLRRA
jgi:tRNA (cytidine/uridine-2'-O-)-methyltransferase